MFTKKELYVIDTCMDRWINTATSEEEKIIRTYICYPEKYVEEVIGINPDNGFNITSQQRELYKAAGRLSFCKKLARDAGKTFTLKQLPREVIRYSKKLGISVRSGRGCHIAGTKVRMYDGSLKAVEDVVIGDLLMGDDSTPRTVLELKGGFGKMFRVKGRTTDYVVNEDHILVLRNYKYKHFKGRQEIQEITVRDFNALSDYRKQFYQGIRVGVEYNPSPVPLDPYYIGMWLGDGNSGNATITNIDREILEYLELFCKNNNLNFAYKEQQSILTKKTGSHTNPVIQKLKKLDLIYNKHIPEVYLHNSREVRLQVLAGLIDSDGWFDYRNKGESVTGNTCIYYFSNKNKGLAENVVELARSLGFSSNITKVQKSCMYKGIKKTGTYYNVSISKGDLTSIPCKVERKKCKHQFSNFQSLSEGITIEYVKDDDYYGFLLDDNNRYLLEDFTVTHNTGKTAATSCLIYWFLSMQGDAKCPVVGPTQGQLKNVLWKEIMFWYHRRTEAGEYTYKDPFRSNFECLASEIKYDGGVATAYQKVSPRNADSGTLQAVLSGEHYPNMMICVDEASSIPPDVFLPIEGTLTTRNSFLLMLFNPTKTSGYAYDSHFHSESSKHFIKLHWNAEESELVSPEFLASLEQKYGGKESNNYRVSVLGIPPSSDDNSLIPYIWVNDAKERFVLKEGRSILGVDVARTGGDSTIVCVRYGAHVEKFIKINKIDTVDTASAVLKIAEEYDSEYITVDSLGIGAGLYDILRRTFPKTYAVEFSRGSRDPKFRILRDELYFKLRGLFEKGRIAIPEDEDLSVQLSTIRYSDENGKIKIEPKDKIRQRLGGDSPDYADSLAISLYVDDIYNSYLKQEDIHDPYKDKFDKLAAGAGKKTWMSV